LTPQDKRAKEIKRLQKMDDADESELPSRQLSPDAIDEDEFPAVYELQWAKDIFETLGDEYKKLKFTEYSNKARLVLSIVKEAVKLDDNTLIFVHSIPTLNYLREKLYHKHYHVFELTGMTPMKDRQHDIDRFNKKKGAVYLISCRVLSPSRFG
jgi:superfamily II DNA or RNA helicase